MAVMPLPGTRVIPKGWQAHHAPVAQGGMTAVVDLHDPELPATEGYDRESGQSTSVPAPPVWRGTARVQSLAGREQPTDAAGQEVLTPPYLIAVPHTVTAQEGWVVQVTACPDDAALVGRRFTVRQVAYATQRFQRDLFCDDE